MKINKSSKTIILILIIISAGLILSACSGGSGSGGSSSSDAVVIESASLSKSTPIYAALGTEAQRIIDDYLPVETTVKLSDGREKTAELAWQIPEDYDSQTLGSYIFTGLYNISEIGNGEIDAEVILTNTASISGDITTDYNYSLSFNSASISDESEVGESSILSRSNSVLKKEYDGYIIAFSKAADVEDIKNILRNNGGRFLRKMGSTNTVLAEAETDIELFKEKMQKLGEVKYIEPNYKVYLSSEVIPDDAEYSSQWNLKMMDLNYAWNYEKGDSRVRVAVIDTGIDTDHPDLSAKLDLENALDFSGVEVTGTVEDGDGHGTHVAGIISALTDNPEGIAGVSWQAEILPIKALDDFGSGSVSSVVDSVYYAAGLHPNYQNPEPVDVINLSLGTSSYSTALENAVNEAAAEGIIITASAGNDGSSYLEYPAAYDAVIAVGAADISGDRASYSNYSSDLNLDFIAPGGDSGAGILSTVKNNDYGYKAGTSMASPHAAGLAVLMLAQGVPSSQIREKMHQASIHPGTDSLSSEYGNGLLNANFALNNVQKIKVVLGERTADTINVEAEAEVDIKGGGYSFGDIPLAEYRLYAWIDISDDGVIDAEDYISESGIIDFSDSVSKTENLELIID